MTAASRCRTQGLLLGWGVGTGKSGDDDGIAVGDDALPIVGDTVAVGAATVAPGAAKPGAGNAAGLPAALPVVSGAGLMAAGAGTGTGEDGGKASGAGALARRSGSTAAGLAAGLPGTAELTGSRGAADEAVQAVVSNANRKTGSKTRKRRPGCGVLINACPCSFFVGDYIAKLPGTLPPEAVAH